MTLICKTRWFALSIVLGTLALIGCGPAETPSGTVSGTVTLEGEPVESGEISFVSSDGFAAAGPISGGQFKLEDPLPVGKYSIGVGPATLTEAPGAEGGDAAIPTSPVPAGYQMPGTSGLSQDIQQGANSVKVELSKSGPAAGSATDAAP